MTGMEDYSRCVHSVYMLFISVGVFPQFWKLWGQDLHKSRIEGYEVTNLQAQSLQTEINYAELS
jgi:hypothetical protein